MNSRVLIPLYVVIGWLATALRYFIVMASFDTCMKTSFFRYPSILLLYLTCLDIWKEIICILFLYFWISTHEFKFLSHPAERETGKDFELVICIWWVSIFCNFLVMENYKDNVCDIVILYFQLGISWISKIIIDFYLWIQFCAAEWMNNEAFWFYGAIECCLGKQWY